MIPILVQLPRLLDIFSEALIPALEDACSSSTRTVKALILTNPHNPSGRCYSKHILEEILRFCHRKGIHLISEELFALSTFQPLDASGGGCFTSALALDSSSLGFDPAYIHVIWSMSKDFASAGIKLVRQRSCKLYTIAKSIIIGLHRISSQPSIARRTFSNGFHECVSAIDHIRESHTLVGVFADDHKSKLYPTCQSLPEAHHVFRSLWHLLPSG